MIKLVNIMTALFLVFTACKTSSEQPSIAPGNAPGDNNGQTGSIRFLALGDSYTIGQSVSEDQRWPVLMVNELKRAGKAVMPAEIIARTGWTTRDLINRLDGTPSKQKYDLVSLQIGVNNQYQGRSVEEYRNEFNTLLEKAVSYSNGGRNKVFVLSIPDWGVTPYASGSDRNKISVEIDQFNKIAREECMKQGIVFIDITPVSRTALNDKSLVATDGLHFSGKMHQLWVNEAISIVSKKI